MRAKWIWLTVAIAVVALACGAIAGGFAATLKSQQKTNTSALSSAINAPSTSHERRSYLAVVTAASLTAEPLSDGTQRVILENVDAQGAWFTDRPNRQAGSESTRKLLDAFVQKYPSNPPNVTISMIADGKPVTRIVAMSEVSWDGALLSFVSTPLSGDPLGVLAPTATDVSVTIDANFNECQLSINQPGDMQYLFTTVTYPEVSTRYGEFLTLNGQPGYGYSGLWQGTWDEGCGGTLTATVVSPTGEACGQVTLQGSNPEFGDDTYSVSTSAGAVSAVLDEAASVLSGYSTIWYVVVHCQSG